MSSRKTTPRPTALADQPRALTIAYRPLRELIPYARNSRTHPPAQIDQIKASLTRFGWTNPMLIAGNEMIAGHARLVAALAVAESGGAIPGAPDPWHGPTVDLSHLSAADRAAYVIADNRLAERAGWDTELLRLEMTDLQAAGFDLTVTGFEAGEIADLFAPPPPVLAPQEGEDPADAEVEAPAPVTRPGDIWRLGEHRLLCADAADIAARSRLMDGERAALLFTSPPYGNQRDYTTGGIGDWDALMRGVFAGLAGTVADDGQVIVNLGLIHRDGEWFPYWQAWLDWMRAEGWRRFGLYVWDQGPGMPGNHAGRLAASFELLFHLNRTARQPNKIIACTTAGMIHGPGGTRNKNGKVDKYTHAGLPVQDTRIPDNIVRIPRASNQGVASAHPAVFPVRLPEFLMQSYTDAGEIVFDPFVGSGTSILAGQRAGRRVRAIELAPLYVDIAIARWRQQHPEIPVVLAESGEIYDRIAAERLTP